MRTRPGKCLLGGVVCCLLLFILAVFQIAAAQQASVRASLSSSTITLDESVILTIRADGVDGQPDTSALAADFDIISQSSAREISTISRPGSGPEIASFTTWTVELMPKSTGVFTVPAVSVDGVSSQLLSLTVNEVPAGARRDVFFEASVDSTRPWIQSQVLMTVKVFLAVDLVDGNLGSPSGANLLVQRVGDNAHYNESRNGRAYRVIEQRYALFPQVSGLVSVDPVKLHVTVPAQAGARGSLFAPTRRLVRRTRPIELDVQARPSDGARWWLPASMVQLDSHWGDAAGGAGGHSSARAGGKDSLVSARVGQPLTRTIRLRASGVTTSQLPDIALPALDQASVYAEEATPVLGTNERGLLAEQSIQWALIPQEVGELVLPEIRVEWFDTDSGKPEVALLPAERVVVSPASGSSAELNAKATDAGTVPASTSQNDSADRQAGSVSASGESSEGPDGESDLVMSQSGSETDTQALAMADSNRLVTQRPAGESTTVERVSDSALHDSPVSVGKNIDGVGARGASVANSSSAPVMSSSMSAAMWPWVSLLATIVCVSSLLMAWYWRRRYRRLFLMRSDSESFDELLFEGVEEACETEPCASHSNRRGMSLRARAGRSHVLQRLIPLAEVAASAESGKPLALRQSLLNWSAKQWPHAAPKTLLELATRLGKSDAADSVRSLDALIYAREIEPEQRHATMQSMRQLPEQLTQAFSDPLPQTTDRLSQQGVFALVDKVRATIVGKGDIPTSVKAANSLSPVEKDLPVALPLSKASDSPVEPTDVLAQRPEKGRGLPPL